MTVAPTIVLVHGGFLGGWCWERVLAQLIADGARVFTPTLAGLGDRAAELGPTINLSTHIDQVVALIERENLSDITLCGHSYGGMVATGVLGRLAPRIARMVYLDALVSLPGEAVWDHLSPTARATMDAATVGAAIHPARAGASMVNAADAAWVDRFSTPQPRATLTEPLPAPAVPDTVEDKTYVFATGYASPMLRRCADAVVGKPGWRRIDLPFGHNLMIDAPAEVAAILLDRPGVYPAVPGAGSIRSAAASSRLTSPANLSSACGLVDMPR